MTTDHGQTSNRVTLPIGQMYHVAVDNDVPYHIYGNMQDDGTMRGPSTTQEAGPNVPGQGGGGRGRGGFGGGRGGGAAVGAWEHNLGGCESGFTLPDVTDYGHRLGLLLRRRSDPLRRPNQAGALRQPVAAHARFGAQPGEVSLPLDRAAGHRSVRSQHASTTAARWFSAPPTAA